MKKVLFLFNVILAIFSFVCACLYGYYGAHIRMALSLATAPVAVLFSIYWYRCATVEAKVLYYIKRNRERFKERLRYILMICNHSDANISGDASLLIINEYIRYTGVTVSLLKRYDAYMSSRILNVLSKDQHIISEFIQNYANK